MKHLPFFFVICALIIFSGCASNKSNGGGKLISGPAADDLVNYVNQGLIAIAELEQESLKRYETVTGENFTSNQNLIETLKNFIVPTYKRFVRSLKNITPEKPEVQKIHAIYIRAAESTLEGFQMIMVGCENNDEKIIQQGNKKLDEGRTGIEKWRTDLIELAKINGAEIIFK